MSKLNFSNDFPSITKFERFSETLRSIALRHPWRGFQSTDPSNFGDQYKLLIHSITRRTNLYENQIDLIDRPEDIQRLAVISSSLINQDKTTAFGNSGVILDIPYKLIKVASPKDAHVDAQAPYLSLIHI